MSPGPFPDHSEIINEIVGQLWHFRRGGGGVRVFADTDVRLTTGKVYRPDIAAYRSDRLKGKVEHLTTPPDLAVEVLSPSSKAFDLITKRDDYEQFEVAEYWAIDPENAKVRLWRRSGVRLLEGAVEGDSVKCEAIPGFSLDLAPIRKIAEGR